MRTAPLLLLAVACAHTPSGAPLATTSADSSPRLSADDSTLVCVRLREEAARCAPEFTDVDLELRSNVFPEVAAALSDAGQRDELRKKGIEQAITRGTGPRDVRERECASEATKATRDEAQLVESCAAKGACGERMRCLRPLLERRYEAAAASGASQ